MQFENVKSKKLSEKVAFQIIEMIEKGELKPGDKLPTETVLAEKLGVSRGIVREGLSILQYKGYISRKPRDGTYIRELSDSVFFGESVAAAFKKASYIDLLEMREALEQKIVELAIKKSKDEDLLEIKNLLEKGNLADSNNILLNSTFHLKLAQLSKNVLLINFIETYYGLIQAHGKTSFKSDARKAEVVQEHMAIIQAVINRDEKAAKHAVLEHLKMVEKSIDTINMDEINDI